MQLSSLRIEHNNRGYLNFTLTPLEDKLDYKPLTLFNPLISKIPLLTLILLFYSNPLYLLEEVFLEAPLTLEPASVKSEYLLVPLISLEDTDIILLLLK